MKKAIQIVLYIGAFLGLIFILLLFFGYKPVKVNGAFVDWQGAMIIVESLAVLALVGTVFYQVYNNKIIANRQENLIEEQINMSVVDKKIVFFEMIEKRFELYSKICKDTSLNSVKFDMYYYYNNIDDFVGKAFKQEDIDDGKRGYITLENFQAEGRKITLYSTLFDEKIRKSTIEFFKETKGLSEAILFHLFHDGDFFEKFNKDKISEYISKKEKLFASDILANLAANFNRSTR